MIEIINKNKCCGCFACATACPKQCISMISDEEGFLYPKVDSSICVDCGLCERVCPFYAEDTAEKKPLHAYAAKNPDETTRRASSSGGLFSMFAKKVIEEGGVVFGAQFNSDWEVVHGKALTKEELYKFRGSKYVQSKIGNTFAEAKDYLRQGRKVLFSGTSCQIMGLKRFLGKEYENLFTIDVICHGVPSPKVWRNFLKEMVDIVHTGNQRQIHTCFTTISPDANISSIGELDNICFRDKTYGWRKLGFSLSFSKKPSIGSTNNHYSLVSKEFQSKYHSAFNFNLILRPSCMSCPAKGGRCGSDVTLADFWGIERVLPDFSDDIGVSLCICNTTKSNVIFHSLNVIYKEVDFYKAVEKNQSWYFSKHAHPNRDKFFKLFIKDGFVQKNVDKCMRTPFITRNIGKIKSIIKKIIKSE